MLKTSILNLSWKEQGTFTFLENPTHFSRDGKYQIGLNQVSEKDTILIHMLERCGIKQFLSADTSRPPLLKNPNLLVQISSTCSGTETMLVVKEQESSTMKIQNLLSIDTKEDLNQKIKKDCFHSKMLIKTSTLRKFLELIQTPLKVNRNSLKSSLFGEKQCLGCMKIIAKLTNLASLNKDLKNLTSNECGITTEPTTSNRCSQSFSKMDRSHLTTLTERDNSLTKMDFLALLFST